MMAVIRVFSLELHGLYFSDIYGIPLPPGMVKPTDLEDRIIQWLPIQPQHETHVDLAATCGYFKVLKWLHQHGQYGDEDTYVSGAKHGLKMIEWLYNHSCPWNELLPAELAQFGDLETLKWIKSNLAPR